MDKEKILAEAKRRYPIGTIVESLGGSGHQEIKHHNFYMVDDEILRATKECLLRRSSGKWATIIKSPIKCYELW
jgi:hypothetical protein